MNIKNGNQVTPPGAVVLAGGRSSRLGMPKSLLPLRGRTFLEHIVHQVGQFCSPIVVVGDIDPAKHQLSCPAVVAKDEHPDQGPMEGIRVGLKTLETDCELAFVTSCDVPLIRPEVIHLLHSLCGDHDAVVPHDQQYRYGLTAVYRTSIHAQIGGMLKRGERKVASLADQLNTCLVELDRLKQVDPQLLSLKNVNTIEEYRALLDEHA